MSDNRFLTREQRAAVAVFSLVAPLAPREKPFRDSYGSLAHKLPVLIRSAGLAQAVAFVHARNKAGTPQRMLLDHLQDVLRTTDILPADMNLAERSRMADFDEYIRLTEATLAALLWFKRFAQSELKVASGTVETSAEISEGSYDGA